MSDQRPPAALIAADYIKGRLDLALNELEKSGLTNRSNLALAARDHMEFALKEVTELIRSIEDGAIR